MNFIADLFSGGGQTYPAPCVMGGEELMSEKGHGTSATPVQPNLRWDCDVKVADRICNFNRHYAEYRGEFIPPPPPKSLHGFRHSALQNIAEDDAFVLVTLDANEIRETLTQPCCSGTPIL